MTKYIPMNQLYDVHPAYMGRRDLDSEFRKKYLNEIDFWKIKYLAPLLNKRMEINTIVEVGSATGDLIGRFPINVPLQNRYGIDFSFNNISAAEELYPEVNFYCGTFEKFVQEKGKNLSLDIVILSDILEHVKNDCELLKKAGDNSRYVLLNLPLEKCLRTVFRSYGERDLAGHLRAYSLKDAFRLIDCAKLKIMDYKVKYYCKESIYRKHFDDLDYSRLNSVAIRFIDNYLYKIFNVKNLFCLLVKK